MYVEVTGAYGRQYVALGAAKADWDADLDFRSTTGPYVNKSDALRLGLHVIVRYGRDFSRVGTLQK